MVLTDSGFAFKVTRRIGRARIGVLYTPHGQIETPVFMPVGTQGTIKACSPDDVWAQGVRIILSNAYHLFLRPGVDVIQKAGGLHSFMKWPGAILTDSGGFQIFSLGRMVSVTDEGAVFRSHIDGSLVRFTPEDAIQAQKAIGSDICMCLDQCTTYPISEQEAKEAARRTVFWARRAKMVPLGDGQALFGIVQGSTYPELRRECALSVCDLDFSGYAIGGLSVGEAKDTFYEMVSLTASLLPEEKPRYLMGVGHPLDLVKGVSLGVDMFDCVLPTRNARHGRAFTFEGALNLRNASYREDFRPLEEGCDCYACRSYSRSYIRHLLVANESFAWTLLSLHNIRFFQRLMAKIKENLISGTLDSLEKCIKEKYPFKADCGQVPPQ